MLVGIEATYSERLAAYEKRKGEVARNRAQLTAYYEAVDARKRGSGETAAARIPGRVDFILAGIKAEMTIEGAADAFPLIDEAATLELGETIAGFEIDDAIGMALDQLDLAARFSQARRDGVKVDLVFCEETLGRCGKSRPRELRRALSEIADHFRVHRESDPVYGLPEERWRAIIEEWMREFEVPAAVVRYTAAGGYRGEKSHPVIVSTRLFREYRDPATGVAVSPAAILELRFRKAAGLAEVPALGEPRDIAANFLKPAHRFLKQSRGTAREKSAERLLADMEAIAPVVLAPGGIYAAKRARDRFPGRFFWRAAGIVDSVGIGGSAVVLPVVEEPGASIYFRQRRFRDADGKISRSRCAA